MLTNPKSVAGPSPFSELALNHSLQRALDTLGYATMTEIQAMSVGPILAGRDVLARSKTGSGKTIAFGIGLLSQLIGSHGEVTVSRSGEAKGSSDPQRTQLDRSFAWPQALVLAHSLLPGLRWDLHPLVFDRAGHTALAFVSCTEADQPLMSLA